MVSLLLTLNRFHVYITLNRFHICSVDTEHMYRDYKTFNIKLFKRKIGESLENHTTYDYSYIFIALNKHAPINKKIMRFNNNDKSIEKAIMHRSKLKIIYNEYRTEGYWVNYKKAKKLLYKYSSLD